jgi:flagellin
MSSDITLSASVRSSLLSLNNTQDMVSKTQSRLTTGQKVNSALDSAQTYFQARSLNDRASDLSANKSQLQNAVSTIGAAANGLNSVEGLLKQAKGIAMSAASDAKANASAETMQGYANQYNDVLKQIDKVAGDSSYNGINLLSGGKDMTVQLNETGKATLNVQSKQLDTSEKSLNLQPVTAFGKDETARLQSLDTAINSVRGRAAELGGNSAAISARIDFTNNYTNTLQSGSGKLTLADLNSEGANLVALQTRQQLGVQSLSIAGQQEQAILSLLR